jgi:hypothetical protein
MRTLIIGGVIVSVGTVLGFRWLMGKIGDAIEGISLEEIREERGVYYEWEGQ